MTSIYLFKTEEFYGGETKVFTNRTKAYEYLTAFLIKTDNTIDAVIEEHTSDVRENHDKDDQTVTWKPVQSIY
jgi:hypothetical protein